MVLHEFTVHFRGDYTPELRQTYSMLHGEDLDSWPDTETRTKVVIDLSKIIAFNDVEENDIHAGKTNVRLESDYQFLVCLPFSEFKKIIEDHYLTPIPSHAI